jgi:hypothetical protein
LETGGHPVSVDYGPCSGGGHSAGSSARSMMFRHVDPIAIRSSSFASWRQLVPNDNQTFAIASSKP